VRTACYAECRADRSNPGRDLQMVSVGIDPEGERMRVAIGGISGEPNTFSNVPTGLERFPYRHVRRSLFPLDRV
jgi:hypothetical protein